MSPDLRAIRILARRELQETLRRKSIWVYTGAFVVLAGALSLAGTRAAGYSGLGGFGRTSASLVNALLLFIPLIALSAGSASLLVDRERGTLPYLLAQPITRTDLFLGKTLGTLAALAGSVVLAFLLVVVGMRLAGGSGVALLLGLLGQTLLFAVTCLALGLAIGSLASNQTMATGLALATWLFLAFLGDAAFLLTALALQPGPVTLLGVLLANPAQAYRLGAIHRLRGDLADVGPLGAYADTALGGSAGLVTMLVLLGWGLLALLVAYAATLRRRAA